jgi:hypothetical protein
MALIIGQPEYEVNSEADPQDRAFFGVEKRGEHRFYNCLTAENDAKAMDKFLDDSQIKFKSKVVLLKPKKEEIEAEMNKIMEATFRTEPMIIFIYYSGHAVKVNEKLHLVMPDHTKNRTINIRKETDILMRKKNVQVYAFYDYFNQK